MNEQGLVATTADPAQLPLVTVIVLACDPLQDVPACCAALAQQTYPRQRYHVVVVGETQTPPGGWPYRLPGHSVFNPAPTPGELFREGVLQAHGDVVALIRASCVPATDWLERLLQPLVEEKFHVAQGRSWARPAGRSARFAALESEDTYEEWERMQRFRSVESTGVAIRRDRLEKSGPPRCLTATLDGLDRELARRLDDARARFRFVPAANVQRSYETSFGGFLARQFTLAGDVGWQLCCYGPAALRTLHRPGTLKIQASLVVLLLCNFAFLAVARPDFYFYNNLVVFGLFLLSTSGTLAIARRHDPGMTLWAVGFLFVRAVVAVAGVAAGWLRGLLYRES